MKENKEKGVVNEETLPEMESQPRPSVRDKRKKLSKTVELENLPSHLKDKRAKHRSSKTGVVKPSLTIPLTFQQSSIKVHDVDSFMPIKVTPSMTTAPTLSQPSQRVPMNLVENKDLAWEQFQIAVINKDMAACYDMSLKEFEYSTIHDLLKVCNFTFSSSWHFTFFSSNKIFFFNNFRQCQSSSQHLGRPRQDEDTA